MKYARQFMIIALIALIGEILNALIPLPIPASIYGIVILFALLMSGALKVSDIKETSSFLIAVMPIMFIPATVGLMESADLLLPNLTAYIAVMVISTFIVMLVSGRAAQHVIRRRKAPDAKQNGKEERDHA